MRLTHINTTPVHVTYRLHGSIPNLPLSQLHEAYRFKKTNLQLQLAAARKQSDLMQAAKLTDELNTLHLTHYQGYDKLLHESLSKPHHLRRPDAKRVILDSWQVLPTFVPVVVYAVSVMSNPVHVVLAAREKDAAVDLADLLTRHKRFTARELNQLHHTPGRRVWAEKEYSRMVRRGRFGQVIWYVVNNPVKAGLTNDPLNWEGNWYAPELYEGYILPRVA